MRDFMTAVRLRDYDEIVDTQGLLRSALMARCARGRRHGYDAQSIRERLATYRAYASSLPALEGAHDASR